MIMPAEAAEDMRPYEEWRLETRRLGRRVLLYHRVDSTNTLAAVTSSLTTKSCCCWVPPFSFGSRSEPRARARLLPSLFLSASTWSGSSWTKYDLTE